MENCFIKKLKGVAQDENMNIFGAMKFANNGQTYIRLKGGCKVTYTGSFYDDYGNVLTSPHIVNTGGETLKFTGEGTGEIQDYYDNLEKIFSYMPPEISDHEYDQVGLISLPLDFIKYAQELTMLVSGDPSDSHFAGTLNIADISSDKLERFVTNSSWIKGELKDFKSEKLTRIRMATGGVYGSIEDAVEAQIAKGRVSGTLQFDLSSCQNITFHQVHQNFQVNAEFSNGAATLKKVNNTIIATYDGTTWSYN